MGIAASELCQYVIRPTLLYLDRHSPCAESFLLCAAACQSALGSALDDQHGHGLFRIGELRHQLLWDDHLARDPDLASRVRGLASQHAFLAAPHLELTVNLRYATAIAWMMVEAQSPSLPERDDIMGMAKMWRQVFQPEGRLGDFSRAWHHYIGKARQAA